MTTIALVRHGDNDFIAKRIAGRTPNVHLNFTGNQQAQELAQTLSTAPIEAIFSSPLERAIETAQPLADLKGLPIQIETGIIEIDFGDYQGKTWEWLYQQPHWIQFDQSPADITFPNGESIAGVQQRAVTAIEKIAQDCRELKAVALFTHGDIIRLAVAHYLRIPLNEYRRFIVHPASITLISMETDKPRTMHLNYYPRLEWGGANGTTR